jgi:hypothetical protein
MKVVKVNIPIYFGYLRIVIAKDFTKAAKKIKYKTDLDLSLYGAFVYADHNNKGITVYTVFFRPNASHSGIAHEAVHLVNHIFRDRHMLLDTENDEPQAYLTGWINNEIYKALKK